MSTTTSVPFTLALTVALAGLASPARADDREAVKVNKADAGWVELIGPSGHEALRPPAAGWETVGSVALNPENPRRLVGTEGEGVLFNGAAGRAPNLLTKEKFGDVEAHFEFLIPKGSNSGVKFGGVYEVQIFDSYGVKTMTGSQNGGIYPRAELLPRYHHIDEGYSPRTNASRPPGEWQTLDVVFHAPKFDSSGKKSANARFVKVILNGQVVHADLDVPYPTGNNWNKKEQPTGPILFQGDHGPVAFRNVRVRPLP